jgi:predicted TIM-barrel fold metal-dependent hydrolase
MSGRRKTMIVDSFTHIIPASYLEKISSFSDDAIKRAVDFNRRMIQERPYASNAEQRIELLKKYNIDYQVVTLTHNLDCNVLPFAREKQLEMARLINDGLAGLIEQSNGILLGMASVPLFVLEDGGLKEMERAIKGLGLKGFCLPSNSQGKPVDAPEFAPFWAKAAEMGVPVFIHPTDPRDRTSVLMRGSTAWSTSLAGLLRRCSCFPVSSFPVSWRNTLPSR